MIDSVWSQSFYGGRRYPRLRGEISADVAVIGGGMAGILCADALVREGLSVAVLERARVGSGQTGGSTAKITSQHGTVYHRLAKKSHRAAELYAQANEWAVRAYVERIRRDGIECDLEERDAYVYALHSRMLLEREYRAQREAGLAVRLTEGVGLPFENVGAIRLSGQAQFHPLKFLHAVARDLQIFENSTVVQVSGTDVYTAHGCVHAKYVVFACHYPFKNFPGLFFTRMHQEQECFLALERAPIPSGMWVSVEAEGVSLRSYGRLTLMGGMSHRTGEGLGGAYAALRRRAERYFAESRVVAHWSAQDCITASGRPYIGRFCPTRPHWMIATGFGKWGMTSSMISARLIADLICERKNPWSALYSPTAHPFSEMRGIAGETAHAVRGLAKVALSFPNESVDALAPGHGGIVYVDGQRAGAYKDLDGKVYAVRPVCTHLGCRLEWNSDDKTWDCPCHGSRFDFRGEPIAAPAKSPLLHVGE